MLQIFDRICLDPAFLKKLPEIETGTYAEKSAQLVSRQLPLAERLQCHGLQCGTRRVAVLQISNLIDRLIDVAKNANIPQLAASFGTAVTTAVLSVCRKDTEYSGQEYWSR